MRQQSFTDMEYKGRRRISKREQFLDIMEEIIPWDEWIALVEPHYFAGKRGRPPMGIEKMLRMYLLQSWFNLSDEGVEDAIYDSYAMRKFMKLDFMKESVPDATTLLHFRRILEESELGKAMFEAINRVLEQNGHMMRGGTIVDATIISASGSVRNTDKKRDEEMSSTRKGSDWHFGMKAHVGVDAGSGLIHSLVTTTAKVQDVTQGHLLLREDDHTAYGDNGYAGIEKRPEIRDDETKRGIRFQINGRKGKLYKGELTVSSYWAREIDRQKSRTRCKVEFVFRYLKVEFGYRKTRYKGLKKNENRLFMLSASANLLMCMRAGRNPLQPVTG
ncbi:MAG: IS5 family transposase [Christensenellales bacterium]